MLRKSLLFLPWTPTPPRPPMEATTTPATGLMARTQIRGILQRGFELLQAVLHKPMRTHQRRAPKLLRFTVKIPLITFLTVCPTLLRLRRLRNRRNLMNIN